MQSNSDFSNVKDNGSNSPWPGGWYVFEDGRVQGPYAAEAAFTMPEKSLAGSPKLVSRKGFAQWYPLKELSELYKIADKLGHRTSSEVDRLEAEVTENLANLEVLRALAQTGADPSVISRTPRVVGKALDPHSVQAAQSIQSAPRMPAYEPIKTVVQPTQEIQNESFTLSHPIPDFFQNESDAVRPRSEPTGPTRRSASRKERKALARRMAAQQSAEREQEIASKANLDTNDMPSKMNSATDSAQPSLAATQTFREPISRPQSSGQKLTAKQALLQEYLMLRGRLRLGEMRSPLMSAFILTPISLFLYWGVWYRDLTRELVWHTRNNVDKNSVPSTWLAWVPIIHIFMAYNLANLVREAEVQNGYKAISPLFAALFAVIPPLSMAYIQDSANQHWRLHVKHSIIDRINGR